MKRALLALVLVACAPLTTTNGVPNLVQVDPGVYRSGQPDNTTASWGYLRSLGITRDVKLNFESEGSDSAASVSGIAITYLPIQPDGDLVTIIDEPDTASIFAAAEAMHAGGGVLVHCTHGQDRTGLAVGVYRVLYDGWSKDKAWDEMISRGFHVELVGLLAWWTGWNGKAP